MQPTESTIARRTISGVFWNAAANAIVLVVGLVRSILLARLLPVETFGIYAFAGTIVGLSAMLPQFGLGWAFLHRAPETRDESTSAANFFALQLLFTGIWSCLMITGSLLFAEGELRTALWVLCGASAVAQLNTIAQFILVRRVVHRRLALLQVGDILLTTLVAVFLAWHGVTLWALLATNISTALLHAVMLYLWRPVWRPRLRWDVAVIRYFLRFGSRQFLAEILRRSLDQVDDLWTGIFLGNTAMGYYSRAYTFATYPRRILALPVNTVVEGTFAELKEQPQRLAKAFSRTNALLIRSGFLLAGGLSLIAPEFIRIALTDRWLPMLSAFQLMLVYALFDPLKGTIASVLLAVGKPELVLKIRLVQLGILVGGLFALGPLLNIAGVALAVDLMLVTGIALLLWQARKFVNFSLPKLFGVPALGLGLGLLLAHLVARLPGIAASDWYSGAAKIVVFTAVYSGFLGLLERRDLYMLWTTFREEYLGEANLAAAITRIQSLLHK